MRLRTSLTRRRFGALVAGTAAVAAHGHAADDADIDLALALAIDCSFSVDTHEFRMQMQGLGEALMSAEVAQAIAKGPKQKIAVIVYHWSDDQQQRVLEPWTVIDSAETAAILGRKLLHGRRVVPEGGTAISAALLYGAALFEFAPKASRRVIDLATDGRNNMGRPANQTRDILLARGITINGLAICNEWPTLDVYLENNVAGGPGHFVEKTLNYDDFGAAMLRKLVREIIGPGMT